MFPSKERSITRKRGPSIRISLFFAKRPRQSSMLAVHEKQKPKISMRFLQIPHRNGNRSDSKALKRKMHNRVHRKMKTWYI